MLVHSLAVFSDPRSLSRSTKQILSVTNVVISLRLAHLSPPLPDGETGGKKRKNCSTLDVSLGKFAVSPG